MANTPDLASCPDAKQLVNGPDAPFYALSYHFGMLLGVDDFSTEQSYHRGKVRLHNAWLHRDGVVWGFDVQIDQVHGEIRVLPGLALDGAGHELHLDGPACVSVGDWFVAHQTDPDLKLIEDSPIHKKFDAHVEARFKVCFTRQVPSLLEPCAGATGGGTAYSRLFETVDLRLVPGLAPPSVPPPRPYHRLRVLFGLETPVLPADQPVVDARNFILATASDGQAAAYLDAFRRFAVLDEIDLAPAQNADGTQLLGPAADDAPVMLANIAGLTIDQKNGVWTITAPAAADVTIRSAHVATSTIQELLCGPLFQDVGASGAAAGPRVLPTTVTIADNQTITFQVDQDLHVQSVKQAEFSVTVFDDAAGWQTFALAADPVYAAGAAKTVTIKLAAALPAGARVRLLVRGTGPTPILSTAYVPLAGAAGGPSVPANEGRDFVSMIKRS